MKPLVIQLDALIGFGVIVPWPSGVAYQHQTGGVLCMQQELEGAFVPLQGEVVTGGHEQRVLEHFRVPRWRGPGTKGLPDASADFLDEVLLQAGGYARLLQVDRTRLDESEEAWVWVETRDPDRPFPLVLGWPRFTGVLVWQNSD